MSENRELVRYLSAGCSPSQALDTYLVRDCGLNVATVAMIRDVSERAVEMNIEKALDETGGWRQEEIGE